MIGKNIPVPFRGRLRQSLRSLIRWGLNSMDGLDKEGKPGVLGQIWVLSRIQLQHDQGHRGR